MYKKDNSVKDEKNLGMAKALWHALRGFDINYYPRQNGKSIGADAYLPKMEKELERLDTRGAIGEGYLNRAKESLKEVKDLTEYQDQKSARLLTIIAFLTAASGALFAKFIDAYPIRYVITQSYVSGFFVAIVYFVFGSFLLFVASGALVSFHATQTRFVWPKEKSDEAVYRTANSHLFFRSILRTDPVGWAQSFIDKTAREDRPNHLTRRYYKNYIAESYLVAAKFGDKLRYLQPAQRFLQWAIRLLILWLLSLFFVVIFVPTASALDAKAPSCAFGCGAKQPNIRQQSLLDNEAKGGPSSGVDPASVVGNVPDSPAGIGKHSALGDEPDAAHKTDRPSDQQASALPTSAAGHSAVSSSAAKSKVRGSNHGATYRIMRRRQHSLGHRLSVCGGSGGIAKERRSDAKG